jgi:hypothetical protein
MGSSTFPIRPATAPEGKSSLMLQTIVPYHWMNNWGSGDKEVYGQLNKKAMDAMIDQVKVNGCVAKGLKIQIVRY